MIAIAAAPCVAYYKMKVRLPEPWNLPAEAGETATQLRLRQHSAYFEWQLESGNGVFWSRAPKVDFRNKRVIEIGCGHGALTIEVAQNGATRVCGIDSDTDRIEYARRNLADRYPHLVGRVSFESLDISEAAGSYDVAVSKDTFEHVSDLPTMVNHIYRLLNVGGVLLVGFGPMFYSPFGDHGRFLGRRTLPWLPLFVPESILLRVAAWQSKRNVNSIADLGLNRLTPAQFRELFSPDKWHIDNLAYNVGDKPLLKLMNAARRLPMAENVLTVSIYAAIRKL